MRVARIDVTNFRSLRDVSIPLSPFTCIVGHNNAGKSSLITALSLFVHGSRLGPTDYYDPDAEIVIRATFAEVTPDVIAAVGEDLGTRLAELVRDETLVLVRRYRVDGTSTLRCVRDVPREGRFTPEGIEAALAGKRGASALGEATTAQYPELIGKLDGLTNKAAFAEAIETLVHNLLPTEFERREAPLPTGLDTALARLFPEPILIPAVKDVADEVKTKEAASFGKIIRIILDSIGESARLEQVNSSLRDLRSLLNTEPTGDGGVRDARLEEVRSLEERVAGYVREQFPQTRLRFDFPPPDLKAVVGNARILLDDGVLGQVESKGDGMKRAVMFALLRSIADLRRGRPTAAVTQDGLGRTEPQRYLFLFEEPELYLHPQAQRVLYDSLVDISRDNQVCVSTHSPYFFSPRGTGTFVRVSKPREAADDCPPASQVRCIDLLSNMSCKDAFQLICYENNAAAFFCDRVVLVEGDSDLLYLKHVAQVMNPNWDFDARNIAVVRINGKGNFRRYREFFEHFGVRVDLITDLDALVDQFSGLGELQACNAQRDGLIQEIDRSIADLTTPLSLNSRKAKNVTSDRAFAQRFEDAMEIVRRVRDGGKATEDDLACLGGLLAASKSHQRCYVLKRSSELSERKERLIHALRGHGVHVLCRGCLEDYYPAGVTGQDKPSKALAAREQLKSRGDAIGCCPAVLCGATARRPEFELIFESLFER